MPISPGVRLGPYEIVSPLGAGGMGEVYRARDTKLGREVALKVLSESFTCDPERLARFEREAQLLAALNHPHIATLYGFEQTDGAQVLVMELVEGETLAARLRSGPLALAEALRIAGQIAEALQAAHEKGIIHRDLKPANVALTEDGSVKVLDFGLAKSLGDAAPGGADVANSPTLTLAATQVGVILGTAAYMAPEQAKGRAADKRSDMWAFGCVLYEMLTGKRAFEGEDVSETMAFVMAREPDLSAVPSDVPAAIRLLVRRCLEKDRRRRLADAAAAIVLLVDGPALSLAPSGTAALPHDTSAAGSTGTLQRRVASVGLAALLLGAAAAASIAWFTLRPATPSVTRTVIATAGTAALIPSGFDDDLALTADGRHVIYRGTNALLVRALDRLEPLALTGLGAPRGPFVSPDGVWIAYFDNTLLRKVAITGGPPITVAAIDGSGPRGATWSDDGSTIVYASNTAATGLQRVAAAGGEPQVLTTPDRERGESEHFWPEFLPGGRSVLFTIMPATGGLANTQIAVLDLATGEHRSILRGGHHAQYVPTGHLVYGAGSTLRSVPFDLGRLEVTGPPVPLLEGVMTTAEGGVNAAVSSTGTLVYVPGGAGARRSLVWVDRQGREEPVGAPLRGHFAVRISPDGTRVALDVRDEENDVWIWDLGRKTLTRLTFDPALDFFPIWSADSRSVFFSSQRGGAANVYSQAADGTGAPLRIIESTNNIVPTAATPDGRALVVRETAGQGADLALLPLSGESAMRPLVRTPFQEANGEISPDGRWLAYQSNESGRDEIYVRPFPDVDSGRWQVSTNGGRSPAWSRDGRELFFRSPEGGVLGVRVEAGSAWRSSGPAAVIAAPYFDLTGVVNRAFDVAPDGLRFLMIKDGGDGAGSILNMVVAQHWFEELKRLVPVN